MRSIRAVFFDCDGVLLDSEKIFLRCLQNRLAQYKTPLSISDLSEVLGKDMKGITAQIDAKWGLSMVDLEVFSNQVRRDFHEEFFSASLHPMTGLTDVLQQLKKKNIRLAVVSSSKRNYVAYVLDALGIADYFDFYLGREDVQQAKPDPEIYQLALKRARLQADEVLVIEDSTSGIQAAKKAGCHVLAYKGSEIVQDTSGADWTIASYDAFRLQDYVDL
uniref:HAD family hydrolase n=1 Tax=Ndongobacter massiliensis TaxID=1871025 RepID=UPI00093160F7|nr:HAD family phosphatase [Ndongobacter massiliensis]